MAIAFRMSLPVRMPESKRTVSLPDCWAALIFCDEQILSRAQIAGMAPSICLPPNHRVISILRIVRMFGGRSYHGLFMASYNQFRPSSKLKPAETWSSQTVNSDAGLRKQTYKVLPCQISPLDFSSLEDSAPTFSVISSTLSPPITNGNRCSSPIAG